MQASAQAASACGRILHGKQQGRALLQLRPSCWGHGRSPGGERGCRAQERLSMGKTEACGMRGPLGRSLNAGSLGRQCWVGKQASRVTGALAAAGSAHGVSAPAVATFKLPAVWRPALGRGTWRNSLSRPHRSLSSTPSWRSAVGGRSQAPGWLLAPGEFLPPCTDLELSGPHQSQRCWRPVPTHPCRLQALSHQRPQTL